jgi:hypothetical protein
MTGYARIRLLADGVPQWRVARDGYRHSRATAGSRESVLFAQCVTCAAFPTPRNSANSTNSATTERWPSNAPIINSSRVLCVAPCHPAGLTAIRPQTTLPARGRYESGNLVSLAGIMTFHAQDKIVVRREPVVRLYLSSPIMPTNAGRGRKPMPKVLRLE